MPPDFGDATYWNERFSGTPGVFEWLQKPEDFLPFMQRAVDMIPMNERRILHIGSGSSNLGAALCTMVTSHERVHNVDFSSEAIFLGQQMENNYLETMGAAGSAGKGDRNMRWSQVNLLDPKDIRTMCLDMSDNGLYTLVIDKSTSDAIACAPEVKFDPSTMTVGPGRIPESSYKYRDMAHSEIDLNPTELLALHLAALTASGGYWIAISYSSDRFDLISQNIGEEARDKKSRLLSPHAKDLWSVEHKQALTAHEDRAGVKSERAYVHQPQVPHWLYFLRRRDTPFHFLN